MFNVFYKYIYKFITICSLIYLNANIIKFKFKLKFDLAAINKSLLSQLQFLKNIYVNIYIFIVTLARPHPYSIMNQLYSYEASTNCLTVFFFPHIQGKRQLRAPFN